MLSAFAGQTAKLRLETRTAKAALEPAPARPSLLDSQRMNRKQRRAAVKQSPPGAANRAGDADRPHCSPKPNACNSRTNSTTPRASTSACCCSSPTTPRPATISAVVLLAQGKLQRSLGAFRAALALMPQLFEQLQRRLPDARRGLAADRRGHAARGRGLAEPTDADQLLGSAGLRRDRRRPLLLCMLQSVPPATSGSSSFSRRCAPRCSTGAGNAAGRRRPGVLLRAGEAMLHQRIRVRDHAGRGRAGRAAQGRRSAEAIVIGRRDRAIQLAALAMYHAAACVARRGRSARRAPGRRRSMTWSRNNCASRCQELALRATIARLTPIDDDVSQRVRQQYEENPYPRWVRAAGGIEADRARRALAQQVSRPPPLRRSAKPTRSRSWSPAAAPAGNPPRLRKPTWARTCSRSISA